MRSQVEKNKEILMEYIERHAGDEMTQDVAARLSNARGAYKALCTVNGDDEPDRHGLHTHSEGSALSSDHALKKGYYTLSCEMAMDWAEHMKNEDGTTGPHWTMEQTEQVRKQKSIDCDPLKFFVTMNMMYSDYCKVAEKLNVSSMDFYAYMSKAFLDDKDARPDKLERYYHCVVKK